MQTPVRHDQRAGTSQASTNSSELPCCAPHGAVMPLRANDTRTLAGQSSRLMRRRRGQRRYPGGQKLLRCQMSGSDPRRIETVLRRGWDVLVDVKEVVRVVALLHSGQPVVVAAVRCPDPPFTLVVHHEVDVGASRRGGVQLFPVLT